VSTTATGVRGLHVPLVTPFDAAGAALIAAAHAGRLDEARAHAEALLPLIRALFAEPSPAVLKAMLHDAGRIATPDVRMPLQPASPAGLARARRSAPARSSAPAPARAR
jgi:dihydrodipicolinate synthase/N-acetylneuraminate lyase